MSQFPVLVIFGLSIPPIVLELLLALLLYWLVHRLLMRTPVYNFVWHPALFNTALYCCLLYFVAIILI